VSRNNALLFGIIIAIVFATGESWLQGNVSDASRGA